MLVLVSDLHITDETTANNVNPEAFLLLGDEIVDAASRRGAREIHLVLLGDILDLVRSDHWHRLGLPMAARPWGGQLDPDTGMNPSPAIEIQFRSVLDSVAGSEDVILDFVTGEDRIDLRFIDADTTLAGDQPFSFSSDGSFHDTRGEVRALFDGVAGQWRVEGDIDGDSLADFTFLLNANNPLTASDFVL